MGSMRRVPHLRRFESLKLYGNVDYRPDKLLSYIFNRERGRCVGKRPCVRASSSIMHLLDRMP